MSGKKEKEVALPWWDHAVSVGLAGEYIALREWEREVFGFRILAEDEELIQDDGWGE